MTNFHNKYATHCLGNPAAGEIYIDALDVNFAKRLFVSKAVAKQRPGTPPRPASRARCSNKSFQLTLSATSTMSAIRALRQLALPSSRALASRAVAGTTARSVLAARVAPAIASRAFSVSARRLGEGTCE